MKKNFIWLVITLVSVFILTGCLPKKSGGDQVLPTGVQLSPTPVKTIETTILERLFLSLPPSSDGHRVKLDLKNIRSDAKTVDYELVYFAGDIGNKIERGVTGTVDLKGATSLLRDILFGSESCTAGCKYRYDENVSEGTLTLGVVSSAGKEKYTSAFRLQKGIEGKEGLSAGDGNFILTSSTLAKNSYFLTISTFGLPGATEDSVLLAPYGVFPSVVAVGTVSFKSAEETAKILFWNGQKWDELKSTFADGQISAPIQKTGTFVLVK